MCKKTCGPPQICPRLDFSSTRCVLEGRKLDHKNSRNRENNSSCCCRHEGRCASRRNFLHQTTSILHAQARTRAGGRELGQKERAAKQRTIRLMSLTLPSLRSRRRRDAVLAPWNVKAPPAHGIATATKGMMKYIGRQALSPAEDENLDYSSSKIGRKKILNVRRSRCSMLS